MKKGYLVALFATITACVSGLTAQATPKYWKTPELFAPIAQKYGISTVRCPNAVVNLNSGLATSLLSGWTVCLESTAALKNAVAKKKLKALGPPVDFPLKGNAILGTPFTAMYDQEGDLTTDDFVVGHYPAIAHYTITHFDGKATFNISYYSRQTHKYFNGFERVHGLNLTAEDELSGDAWLVGRGSYFIRIDTNNRTSQPLFSITSSFMDPYEGSALSSGDVKDAGIKLTKCPKYLLDLRKGRIAQPGRGYSCTKSSIASLEDAGFTNAPYSLAVGMFMATGIDASGAGDAKLLPFRVAKTPTQLVYSVNDPSEKQVGTTKFRLFDLATDTYVEKIAEVTGSIAGTTYNLNFAGEYMVEILTTPSQPEKYGDLEWSVSVNGS